MLQIRTLKQIRTSRTIPSFRSTAGGMRWVSRRLADRGRMALGYSQMATQEAHRQWRNRLWHLHIQECGSNLPRSL